MKVFRLSKSEFCRDLTGVGAEKSGGRWNEKGYPVVYASGSRALCLTEVAVHIPLGIIPQDFILTTIEFSSKLLTHEIYEEELPLDWKTFPHPSFPKKMGSFLLKERKHLIIKVPSAVVQGEYNYLINPNHPDISKVKITSVEPFFFDERLFI